MRVVIESPFHADTKIGEQAHLHYARLAVHDSLERGESPYASHLLITQVYDDTVPEERARGIAAQLAWLDVCDIVAVYEDHGISSGMKEAIKYAEKINKPIEFRSLVGINIKVNK